MNTGLVLTFIKYHFNRKKIPLGVGKGFVDELLEDVFHLIGLKFTSELADVRRIRKDMNELRRI